MLVPREPDLAVIPQDRAPHERLALEQRGVVGEVAGREVVAAVDDDVVVREDFADVRRAQPLGVTHDPALGVDRGDGVGERVDLEPAHVGEAVADLAMQVGQLDEVVVDDADGADARTGEVGNERAAEPPGTDDEHTCRGEPTLRELTEAGQHDLPAEPGDALRSERRRRLDQGCWTRAHAAIVRSAGLNVRRSRVRTVVAGQETDAPGVSGVCGPPAWSTRVFLHRSGVPTMRSRA